MTEAFFLAEGEGFRATEYTRGPWSLQHQHAGPPSALVARALEQVLPTGFVVARITLELVRAIPIDFMRTRVEPLRAGRKAQWLSAELLDAQGATLIHARALAVRAAEVPVPNPGGQSLGEVPGPDASPPYQFTFFAPGLGYHQGMELRLARGTFGSGAVCMWMRMRLPLVRGETPSPLQRVLIAADSGNGVSAVLDPRTFSFVNPDLTVHLHRLPAGEWVCLDARTVPQSSGRGLAESRLLDQQGESGLSLQSLMIEARG